MKTIAPMLAVLTAAVSFGGWSAPELMAGAQWFNVGRSDEPAVTTWPARRADAESSSAGDSEAESPSRWAGCALRFEVHDMVGYAVGEMRPFELVDGLKAARSRLKLAFDSLSGQPDSSPPKDGALAVLDEVEGYLCQAVYALDELARLESNEVFVLPALREKLRQHCQPCVEREGGSALGLGLLIQAFVNSAVESVLTSPGLASDPLVLLEDYYGISERLRDSSPHLSPREEVVKLAGKPVAKRPAGNSAARLDGWVKPVALGPTGPTDSEHQPERTAPAEDYSAARLAPEGETWPTLTVEIVPGVYERFRSICARSAAPELGLTPDKLAGVMVNTGISGFFGSVRTASERAEVGEEVRVYHELVGKYGAARKAATKQSEPADGSNVQPAQTSKPGKTRRLQRSKPRTRKQGSRR